MSFSEQEQQPGPAAEQVPEPRLLTRSGRSDRSAGMDAPPRKPQPPSVSRVRRWAQSAFAPRHAGARPRRNRRWAGVALLCLLLLVVAAGLGVLYLRHAMAAALPQLDGEIEIAGLQAPVRITRDAQGVPSITATNLPDMLFAQGYITAGDRLWQMDTLRRHAAGELAEILGPALAEHDRRQRYMQIRAAADRAVAQLPPDQLEQLKAYAHGVNAYMETHADSLPVEFRLLAYKPTWWRPRDSLLVSLAMWQDLSTEFPRKLDREALNAHLPAGLLADLYPVGSWRDQPPVSQGRDLSAPHEVEQIPLDPSQSHVQEPLPRDLLAVSRALPGADACEGCRPGSNNWAVSGAHTASGAPMVANDMHLSLALPDIWYEASLHTGPAADADGNASMDVTGFTLPGVPFVIVGRNAHVAWGVTNLGADVQDVRVEHLRGEGDLTEFERPDGTWAAAEHHREVIRVRGRRDIALDVLTTTHPNGSGTMATPVISPLYPGERRALSLAWTAYDPAAVTSPFLGVNTAADGPSLVAALARFGGPALNLVWADAAGHIGYHALGFIPVRGSTVPQPRNPVGPATPAQQGPLPEDEGAALAQPAFAARPHLVQAAYRPLPRQRGRRAPVRKAAHAAPPPPPEVKPDTPAPPPVRYSIGSPISPVPVDALDLPQSWSAYVPFDALPATVDPRNGYLATANARITPEDFPYAVANDWGDPFRVERIVHMLDGRRGLTPADMLRMETDVHSDVDLAFAQRLAYALDHADAKVTGADAARLREAANLLRDWNGSVEVSSPAAAIVSVVRNALWPALLLPQIASHDHSDQAEAAAFAELYTWGERTSALEVILQHEPARWLPKGFANWNNFLAATTATSLRQAHAPHTLAKWQYGQLHTVEIEHPLFGAHPLLSRLLGIRSGSGAQPAPGDGSTVDAIGAHFGPSERFVADLASADAGLGNLTTGESANPRSPWYFDQFGAWLAGRSFALPGAQTSATHTLTLHP